MIGKRQNEILPNRDYWLESEAAPVRTIYKNHETGLWRVQILWGTERGKVKEVEEEDLSKLVLGGSIKKYN